MANFNKEKFGTESPDVALSKALSFLLRNRAIDEGLDMDSEGFVEMDQILKIPRFKKYTQEMILKVVEKNEKQRYSLRKDEKTGKLFIRANQGHTIPNINPDLKLITNADCYEKIIHGTNKAAYEIIRFEGLNRMERNHIHFAIGEPGEKGVISGMADEANIYIYINMKRAMEDGFKFFESLNKVILCSGNDEGYLPAKYFDRVWDVEEGKELNDFIKTEFNLEEFKAKEKLKRLIHPTSHRLYSKIRRQGLSNTKGRYVNLCLEKPEEKCEVLVYVDVAKFSDEMKQNFLQFKPNEFLYKGIISTDYFDQVIEVKTGINLPF